MLKFLKKHSRGMIFLLCTMSMATDSTFAEETDRRMSWLGSDVSGSLPFVLLAAGGIIFAGIRRWKSMKGHKKHKNISGGGSLVPRVYSLKKEKII
ncbi:MAG: hypothetical protein MRJ65_01305 [Candidatus Brocadiaceae bacterium]|nr:hypothetical protein [Candidatus Brocadiaceae bacterium]